MYLLVNIATPLLSRLAGIQLGIVARLDTVTDAKQAITDQYPKTIQRFGLTTFYLNLTLNHTLPTPHRITLPLMPKIKDEIDRLLSLGVIERVDMPSEWCAPIVVAPKGLGIRLRVDLSRLNDSVVRERHILPSVD